MEVDRRAVPDRFERVADALGEPDDGSGDGSRAVRAVRRILREASFPTLRSCGVSEADVPRLVEASLASWLPVEPGPWSAVDVEGAFRAALAIEER
jgi:alcohol dehydrogenase